MSLTSNQRRLRQRLRDDFEFYAPRCLRIRTKLGAVESFRLNAAQRHLHQAVERQLAERGRVRCLVLKGRQQGCSTYVEGRFFWKVTHRRGVRAFILTHLDDATDNLFGMAKRFHAHMPAPVRPHCAAANAKELVFDRLDSGYRVGTAGSKGAGRSDTIQYFHGSEVAYWPRAEMHVAGALQAVPDAHGTEVILESTSAGRQGLFHAMCETALAGAGDYILVFTPWFWQPEYRRPPAADFVPTAEEAAYAEAHGLDGGQLAWRRAKILELGGVWNFRREYPATPAEAFSAEVPGALWSRDLLDAGRLSEAPALTRIVIGVDPSGGDRAGNDEAGIVAVGLGADGHGYVLEDGSGRLPPLGWASRAVALVRRWQADRIVAEANFGGAMVESTIRTVDRLAPVKLVTASRGKQVRAEPVTALYAQGRVHHVGAHIALEDEMTTWQPVTSQASPNRIDALVWAITELTLSQATTGILDYYAAAAAAL